MSETTAIEKSDVICVTLSQQNIEQYGPLLSKFNSRDQHINHAIANRPQLFKKGYLYDNRDVVYIYLYENPSTKERELMAYVSFSASSLQASFHGEKVEIPTVEIKTFAVDEKFAGKNGFRINSEQTLYKCSVFILEHFLKTMDKLSYQIGITQVFLVAQNRSKVVSFYTSECNFTQVRADISKLGLAREDREYAFIHSLDNGQYRFDSPSAQ